ncbi:MAG: hypothetical protein Q8P67_04630 [archaeon]|nr:hypothetical protein [archaeon]
MMGWNENGEGLPLKAGYFLLQSDFSNSFNPVTSLLRNFVANNISALLANQQPSAPIPSNYQDYQGTFLLADVHVSPFPKKYHVLVGQNPLIETPSSALLLGGWSDPPPILIEQPLNPTPDVFLVQQAISNQSTCDNYQQGAPGFVHFVRDEQGSVTGLEFPGLWYGTFCPKIG